MNYTIPTSFSLEVGRILPTDVASWRVIAIYGDIVFVEDMASLALTSITNRQLLSEYCQAKLVPAGSDQTQPTNSGDQ